MPILAIDQGTTGTTALLLDTSGKTLGRATRDFTQHFPQPGWVEHEPEEIWTSVIEATEAALVAAGLKGSDVEAIGITNQRETTVLWERAGGRAVHRAIVWQDRRTADLCTQLKRAGNLPRVRERTGLVLDPYFSGTKVSWLLDNVPGVRQRAEVGEVCFGTIDSFLVYRLSGGEVFATDVTNASRTLLMNLRSLGWDDVMLDMLRVPRALLPKIVPSASRIATTRGFGPLPDGIPITGIAGDQQAALFGQACFEEGDSKCTYGTGAFILMNTGSAPVMSRFGLLTTVGWQIGDQVTYALEGATFIAGAAVQWLRDGLKIISSASEIEALARSVPSSGGVTFVPALAGLGAPHWDPEARGLISGLTRGTTTGHLARATLEGIALSVNDLVRAMVDDLGKPLSKLRVDGGAAANDLLMQFQSDMSSVEVERPEELESTARGAAMLAGIGAGIFSAEREAAKLSKVGRSFNPSMTAADRDAHLRSWQVAVHRAKVHDPHEDALYGRRECRAAYVFVRLRATLPRCLRVDVCSLRVIDADPPPKAPMTIHDSIAPKPPTGPVRDVPVDWEALEDAFENNAPEVHSYLHLTTGDVLRVVDGVADPQMHARINTDTNYLRIAPVSSREQYRWMERYIPMVEDAELRAKLAASIDGKGAFRRFKDVLMSHSVERERWFTFRSERLRTFMEAWLVAHALKPVPRPSWPAGQAPEGADEAAPGSVRSDDESIAQPQAVTGETREVRRGRNPDAIRKHLRELIEALGPRDLESLSAFAEFLKARRIARSYPYHQEPPLAEPSSPTEEPSPLSSETGVAQPGGDEGQT